MSVVCASGDVDKGRVIILNVPVGSYDVKTKAKDVRRGTPLI